METPHNGESTPRSGTFTPPCYPSPQSELALPSLPSPCPAPGLALSVSFPEGGLSRADVDMEAPGTCHPLDDDWYTYEATNAMKFILPKRYRVKEELGTGSYAAVLSAYDQSSGETIAIKKCDQLFQHPEDGKRVLREIKLLQFFDHPNLVRTRGLLPPRSPQFLDVYILTEFLDMDLKELLVVVGPLDEDSYQSIFYQVACGLNYIHSADVIHRDLKPDNILLNVKNNRIVAKICDFNLSRQIQRRDMTREVVSAAYRPPELLLQTKAPYNSAVDMWSLGGILYEMVMAKQLFPGKKPKHTLLRVLSTIPLPPFPELDWLTHESQQYLRKNCPPLKATVPAKLQGRMAAPGIALVTRLLTLEPAKRPSAAEIMRNPWLRKVQNPEFEFTANRKFQWPSDRVNLTASRLRAMFWQEMLGDAAPLDIPSSPAELGRPGASPLPGAIPLSPHSGGRAPPSLSSPPPREPGARPGVTLPPTGVPDGHPLLAYTMPTPHGRADAGWQTMRGPATRSKLEQAATKPRSSSQGLRPSTSALHRSSSTGPRSHAVRSPLPTKRASPTRPRAHTHSENSSGENGISNESTASSRSEMPTHGCARRSSSPGSSIGSPGKALAQMESERSSSANTFDGISTPRRISPNPSMRPKVTDLRRRPIVQTRSGSPPHLRHPVPHVTPPGAPRPQSAYKGPITRSVTTTPVPALRPASPPRNLFRSPGGPEARRAGARSASQPLAKAKPASARVSTAAPVTRPSIARRSASQPKYPLRQYTSPAPPPTTASVARSKSKPLERGAVAALMF